MKLKESGKSALQWILLKDLNSLILFLCSFWMAMGAHLVTPVIPEIISFFKVTEVKAGLIMSLFTFPTIILSPVIGSLADRYGRKVFLAVGMLLYGVSGVLPFFFKYNFNIMLLARAIQGIGFAAVMPLTITVLGDLYDGSKEVAAQGIRTFFIGAGGFLFPLLGGILAVFGWNFPFLSFSAAIPFAYFIWRRLPDSPVANSNKSFSILSMIKDFRVIKDFYILMVLISSLIRFFLSVGVRVYLPILLVNKFSVNLALAGLILGVMQFVKSFTSLQVGSIAARWGMVMPLVFGFIAYGVGSFMLPLLPSIILISIVMMILGIGDGILAPLQKSLITQDVPPENRAAIVSINASLQGIGRTASPVLVGLIMTGYGLNWAFWFMTLTAAVPVLYFMVNRSSIARRNQSINQ